MSLLKIKDEKEEVYNGELFADLVKHLDGQVLLSRVGELIYERV